MSCCCCCFFCVCCCCGRVEKMGIWKKVVRWKAISDAAAQRGEAFGGGASTCCRHVRQSGNKTPDTAGGCPHRCIHHHSASPPPKRIIGRQTECAATEWMENRLHLKGIKVFFFLLLCTWGVPPRLRTGLFSHLCQRRRKIWRARLSWERLKFFFF